MVEVGGNRVNYKYFLILQLKRLCFTFKAVNFKTANDILFHPDSNKACLSVQLPCRHDEMELVNLGKALIAQPLHVPADVNGWMRKCKSGRGLSPRMFSCATNLSK